MYKKDEVKIVNQGQIYFLGNAELFFLLLLTSIFLHKEDLTWKYHDDHE